MNPLTLELVRPDHPALHSIANQVTDIRSEVLPYLPRMRRLMRTGAPGLVGLGLAAPQIGIGLRFFVTRLNRARVVINPVVLDTSGAEVEAQEYCLSNPTKPAAVIRSDLIVMAWRDEAANYHKHTFTGPDARIVQHEIDHIDGICIWRKQSQPELAASGC